MLVAPNRERLDRFERAMELPLLLLALVMIPVLLAPRLWDLPGRASAAAEGASWAIWAVFAAEFFVRIYLVPSGRMRYVARHWLDVLIVVLPFLRPLRFLRLLQIAAFALRAGFVTRTILARRGIQGSLVAAVLAPPAAAVAVYYVERGENTEITSYGDALWWALATITTVGYGDVSPDTPHGRVVAAFLMVVGIAVFGVMTANIAAYFVSRESQDEAQRKLDLALEELRVIRSRLEARN